MSNEVPNKELRIIWSYSFILDTFRRLFIICERTVVIDNSEDNPVVIKSNILNMEKSNNKFRLFIGSCLALLVTSLTFAMRAKIEQVFGPVDDGGIFGLSKEAIGWAFEPAVY